MPEDKNVPWRPSRFARLKRLSQQAGRSVRARYWFPHIPLSLALAWAGFVLLWIIFTLQRHVLLSDFPKNIFDFRPSSMPYVLIGVAMLIMSVGLLFRSRFAWIVALVLTACTVLSAVIVGHAHHRALTYYDGILLLALLLAYRWFDRSSLAAGTLFAVTSALLLLIYAVFGSLYLGDQFSPQIKDLVTAFYYAVVTMGTVGYGDITPKAPEARLFTVSVIILGLAVFATSVTAIAGPMIGRLTNRKEKRMKRTNHFIVIGATPLAYNTYREFKKRNQTVTLIMPQAPTSGEIEPDDLIIGDASSLEILRKADAVEAQAVLAMRADDSDNAFIVLAVKELKGRAKTVVAISDSKHMERIRLVQPDFVIAPEVLGGELLAMMLSGEPITGDFLMERILHFDRAPRNQTS
ncbi:MAG TPA: voltage-gated potassium channel protein [Terriglobia bacterium]|nr:voltage-gated potassium channel protein [Terriglobia bacterium]